MAEIFNFLVELLLDDVLEVLQMVGIFFFYKIEIDNTIGRFIVKNRMIDL